MGVEPIPLVSKTNVLTTILRPNILVGRTGVEPMISCVSGRCSNQLNYLPIVDRVGVEPTPTELQSVASTELASDPRKNHLPLIRQVV